MNDRPPINETIRAKLEEYDVEHRLEDFVNEVSTLVSQGVAKAGSLVHEHRGDIDALLDKAAAAIDRNFDHAHTERIQEIRGQLGRGVAAIADQRDVGQDSAAPPEPTERVGDDAAEAPATEPDPGTEG